jgi:hypothetical protein
MAMPFIPLKNDGSLALYEGKEQEEYLRELAEFLKKGAQQAGR